VGKDAHRLVRDNDRSRHVAGLSDDFYQLMPIEQEALVLGEQFGELLRSFGYIASINNQFWEFGLGRLLRAAVVDPVVVGVELHRATLRAMSLRSLPTATGISR
jgi:hypothetical protein